MDDTSKPVKKERDSKKLRLGRETVRRLTLVVHTTLRAGTINGGQCIPTNKIK
jgi:hypothetical protein